MFPAAQQVEDDVLHLFGGVGVGEIALHVRLVQEELLSLVRLFLCQQRVEILFRQCTVPAHFLECSRLNKRRRGIAQLHLFLEPLLVLFGHVGDFYSRIEGDSVFIDHSQDGGNKVCNANITMYLISTLIYFFPHGI